MIGTLRRELLDRLLIVNEHHLRQADRVSAALQHARPRRALGQLAPAKLTPGHWGSTSQGTGSAEDTSSADSRTSTTSPPDSPRCNEETQITTTIEYSSPTGWSARTAMSLIASAPSAIATARSTSTRPGSCRGRGPRTPSSAALSSAVSVVVRPDRPQPGPGVRHHSRPIRGDHDPRTRRGSPHSESASLSGPTRSSTTQSPLVKRQLRSSRRGRANRPMKSQGQGARTRSTRSPRAHGRGARPRSRPSSPASSRGDDRARQPRYQLGSLGFFSRHTRSNGSRQRAARSAGGSRWGPSVPGA